MKNHYFILFLLALFSCEKDSKDIDFKIESAPTVLCMSGFVSTDSIYVILSKNMPRDFIYRGGNPYLLQDTAESINVYENDVFFCRLKPFIVFKDSGYNTQYVKVYYTSHKKVTEGKTYSITATHKDFKSVSAKTTIPFNVPIVSVDTFTFFQHEKIWHIIDGDIMNAIITDTIIQYTMFTINFTDPLQYMNYYMIEILDKDVYHAGFLQDPIIETKYRPNSGDSQVNLFTDNFIQGKTYGFQYSVRTDHPYSQTFRLYSLNDDYYKYTLSVFNYNSKTYDTYQEPTPIYSNIQNGKGIIGGFTVSEVKLE
jgi:hypothetical protein